MSTLIVSREQSFFTDIDLFQFISKNTLIKFPALIALGFLVTAVLFYCMYFMVHMEYPVEAAKPNPPMPIITMTIEDIPILPPSEPIKPVIEAPPPAIRTITPIEITAGPGIPTWGKFIPPTTPKGKSFGLGGQMVPFIKIAPQYPESAAAKGIEGFVDVVFNVTALGTTDNIRIVAYEPSTIFNRAVIKAVQGWRYKPREENDVAVMTPDVRDRVRFTLEK